MYSSCFDFSARAFLFKLYLIWNASEKIQGSSDQFVIPAQAGIQRIEITGFWHTPE
jgi:hypothetical protein